MAADVVSSTAPSKAAQKKKAKKEASATAVTTTEPTPPVTGGSADTGGEEPKVHGEGPIKDLQRQVRNVTKKLAATQKVDSIIAENPGVSLDDLVSSKKINLDQKAQALKKPSLQAQLAQLEEQISAFKKVEQDLHSQFQKEKDKLENAHKVELESLRTTLEEDAKVQAAKLARSHLLTLSTFLRAAAERRALADDNSEETRAFEGLLVLLYGGDATAVDAAQKLVDGSSEEVPPNEGPPTGVSYARVCELSGEVGSDDVDDAPSSDALNGEGSASDSASGSVPGTDPTVAYEVMTERSVEPTTAEPEALTGPEQGDVGGDAANAAATDQWDQSAPTTSAAPMDESWVAVPRPEDETEKGIPAPTQPESTNSDNAVQETNDWADGASNTGAWADDIPPPADDGFHEVQGKHRPRGRGGAGGERRGGGRGGGRGGRGEFRGRGRGRGGQRGGSRGD